MEWNAFPAAWQSPICELMRMLRRMVMSCGRFLWQANDWLVSENRVDVPAWPCRGLLQNHAILRQHDTANLHAHELLTGPSLQHGTAIRTALHRTMWHGRS